jgi:hypothetical protein
MERAIRNLSSYPAHTRAWALTALFDNLTRWRGTLENGASPPPARLPASEAAKMSLANVVFVLWKTLAQGDKTGPSTHSFSRLRKCARRNLLEFSSL